MPTYHVIGTYVSENKDKGLITIDFYLEKNAISEPAKDKVTVRNPNELADPLTLIFPTDEANLLKEHLTLAAE